MTSAGAVVVRHLYAQFLENRSQYADAVAFWTRLWEQVDAVQQDRFEWRQPWLFSGWDEHDEFMDGNPIFSAWTPRERKGIRILQYAPTSEDLEFDFWLDMFGGRLEERESVQTLVISCALSEEAARRAIELMNAWVRRGEISIVYPELPVREDNAEFRYTDPLPLIQVEEPELAAV
jgi:hypothetical protein